MKLIENVEKCSIIIGKKIGKKVMKIISLSNKLETEKYKLLLTHEENNLGILI